MTSRSIKHSPPPDVIGNHAPVWEAEAGAGRAFVVSKAPHVVLVVMEGVLDEAAGYRIRDAFDERIRSAATKVHSFWDLDALERYHSAVRVQCTEALRLHRNRLASIHSVSRSRLVSMGVSVANLALGGIIRQHETRADLLKAMSAACAAPPP